MSMISRSRRSGGSMQSRSPVRETAAGKRKTACCPCWGCGAAARAWPCCPWRARECCCSWLRGMVGVPGGRGVPAGGAQRHTEGDKTECRRIVQFEKVRLTSMYTMQNMISLHNHFWPTGSVWQCQDLQRPCPLPGFFYAWEDSGCWQFREKVAAHQPQVSVFDGLFHSWIHYQQQLQILHGVPLMSAWVQFYKRSTRGGRSDDFRSGLILNESIVYFSGES